MTTVGIRTRRTRLQTGDYVLEGHERATIIERKAHLSELHGNLCREPGRTRFIAELQRLRSECSNPVILLEGDPLSLQSVRDPSIDPSLVRDALLRAAIEYNVTVFLLPSSSASSRRATGEWLTALLIAGATNGSSSQEVRGRVDHGHPGPG